MSTYCTVTAFKTKLIINTYVNIYSGAMQPKS